MDEWHDELKAMSAAKSYERTTSLTVQPNQGNPEEPYRFDFPKWYEMGEGIAIPSIPAGLGYEDPTTHVSGGLDRKSTRLNSSHVAISYAVFCLKKKKQIYRII